MRRTPKLCLPMTWFMKHYTANTKYLILSLPNDREHPAC